MERRAPTQMAHFSVHVRVATSAATVHWMTDVTMPTIITATMAGVMSLSASMTLQCIHAVVTMAGLVTVVNRLWSVTVHLLSSVTTFSAINLSSLCRLACHMK